MEDPVGDTGPEVRREVNFFSETTQVLERLRADVVEVDEVTRRVQQREEQSCAGHYLVELDT